MMGFHSVIYKPDEVSRVTPPTTTIRKIIAQQINSQAAIAPSPLLAPPTLSSPASAGAGEAGAEMDKSRSSKRRIGESVAAAAK